jgi:hypothetical protein
VSLTGPVDGNLERTALTGHTAGKLHLLDRVRHVLTAAARADDPANPDPAESCDPRASSGCAWAGKQIGGSAVEIAPHARTPDRQLALVELRRKAKTTTATAPGAVHTETSH